MDNVHIKGRFRHSWWRILLIVVTFIVFIIACIFNGLAGAGPNSIYNQRTGDVSDENLIDFTPAGWTFSIWGIIYFWQAAWLCYALSRIPRKSNDGYLYILPNTLNYVVFIFYTINMGLNTGWLIIWDRENFGWSLLVVFLMFVTILIPTIITHVLLQRNRSIYIASKRIADIWLVRVLVHNGLAIYATWLYLATLINLILWISRIHNRNIQTITDASTAGLSLIFVGIIIYFISENFLFYSSMAYTYLPWLVFIFGLSGIISKNYNRIDVANRNKSFELAILIISLILFIIRIVLFIIRYMKRRIPTINDP